jgi:hypothetical protein
MNQKVAIRLALGVGGIAVAIALLMRVSPDSDKGIMDQVDKQTYQAVFVDNDQIYFGRIAKDEGEFITLNDVYYIKVNSDSSDGKLTRLGDNEPHGPKNQMFIEREHIIFWENLRANSPVVQTIRTYPK